jgi:uroporphyrinogen decarboxylase
VCSENDGFAVQIEPDWKGLMQSIRRKGRPSRVHFVELFLDAEVQSEACRRYGLTDHLHPDDEYFDCKRSLAIQRFLGYDYVCAGLEGMAMPLHDVVAEDTAAMARKGGRSFRDEHTGPITNWDEFESYPWPDPAAATTRALEWYGENLPPNMCIIGGLVGHFAEHLAWLMGYETLCFALYDQRDLVRAIYERQLEIDVASVRRLLEFDRAKIIWGSDDMGFRTGPLIGPDDLREFVLPGHKILARMAHDAGRPYILHSCGNLSTIMEDLIEDVRIDAKHSFEDVIEPITDSYARYGDRIAHLGGIDVDFLCRADEEQVRRRVRDTLETCQPGGGYCLGTGNSVANYIPFNNYIAMLDEGRRFSADSP